MSISVYLAGLAMGLSLILPIGAQNAFVLRQGLRNEHVFAICLVCALSDLILILIGVTGFGQIARLMPTIVPVMRYAGAAFVTWYGIKSLRAALRSTESLTVEATAGKAPLGKALALCLAFTWLNPHVYLDTVVLLGSIATQFKAERMSFAAGAASGSFLFFFALGYGAVWLRPVFAKPVAWRVLDSLIAAVMAAIAVKLVMGV